MRRPGRGLTAAEAQIWARVARTVRPMHPPRPAEADEPRHDAAMPAPPSPPAAPGRLKRLKPGAKPPVPVHAVAPRRPPPAPAGEDRLHLDGSWERRIAKGTMAPDFTLDLHGSSLDQAWSRLMHGLYQAKAMGARVVLVVTGKPRPVDAMDRGAARGAIRAKVADWLAASEHAADIAAVRGAHRRHGGAGAIYVVLKRRR